LSAVRVGKPPLIDGRLDDEAWRAAPGTDAFTQQYPYDGAAASERTQLRVLYDQGAIYFGFDCEQVRTPIVERLTRRDRDSESEWVWVYIDSRNDGKSAFVFAVNISGVLADGQIIDQTTFSWEWDENWEAKTMRTATGWSAEIRIPLRVLRFDSSLPVQSWGLQATRFIAQRQETDLWAYFPRDVGSPVAFLGRLDDLRGLKGGGAVELLPFGVGFARRRDATENMLGSGWNLGGSAGLNLKWHPAQDLTLDGAINPDFAQVEADQVILNLTNFETFLPEKRPFFLEGIDAFSFPLQVFYSRRIGAAPIAPTLGSNLRLVDVPTPATIYGAGKLVGRLGPNWTVGAMSALTSGNTVTTVDMAGARTPLRIAPTTAFNVLRLKRELGGAGHVGLMGTGASPIDDPGFHGAYLGGVDGRWRSPSAEYVLSGAFVQSYIRGGPVVQQLDGTEIGPGATSPGGFARVAKEGGKHLLWSAEYTGAGRKLQYNDVGYMARQNIHMLKASVGWRTLDPGRYTLETSSALEVTQNRNLSWLDLGQVYSLKTWVRLHNFSSVFVAADVAPARFDDREVGTGLALERASYWGGRIELASDPRRLVTATLANQTQIMPAGGYATSAQGTLVVHALRQLDIELLPQITWADGEYRFTRLDPTMGLAGVADGSLLFGKLTARSVSATLRATYTFTPQLTLQAYTQAFLASGHYGDLRAVTPPVAAAASSPVTLSGLAAAQALDSVTPGPDFQDAALNVNVVFRWEWRLGSTLYFVYTHSQIPRVAMPMMPVSLSPGALGRGSSADVLLIKLSYWWAS
jgi:hypothetical protein